MLWSLIFQMSLKIISFVQAWAHTECFCRGLKKRLAHKIEKKLEIRSSDFLLTSRLTFNLFIIFAIGFRNMLSKYIYKAIYLLELLFVLLCCCFFFHVNMLSFSTEYSLKLRKINKKCYQPKKGDLVGWKIIWLIDCFVNLIDWLFDWWIDLLIDRLIE